MTDYSQVAVPDDKAPEDYHWTERRAEIFQMIERKGHPWGFNKAQLGRRYGVSDQQIHDDFDRLKEWYKDRIGDDARVVSDIAFQRIIQHHMENGNFEKARRTLKTWNDWLQDTGEQPTEPEQLELTGEDGGPLDVAINREVTDSDGGD